MRREGFFFLLLLGVLLAACGGKKHDAAFYEARIDSLRKAEQLKQLKQQAGIYDDPVDVFFDTLQVCPLPIQSAGGNISRLAHFTDVPKALSARWDFPVETPLKMIRLPKHGDVGVVMLAEVSDSLPPVLSLMTIDKNYELVDQLYIYERKGEERGDHFGTAYNDYYITSDYEVTLMYAFIPQGSKTPQLESTRRYVISDEGDFQEAIVEF